jgi:hypothetical protein
LSPPKSQVPWNTGAENKNGIWVNINNFYYQTQRKKSRRNVWFLGFVWFAWFLSFVALIALFEFEG